MTQLSVIMPVFNQEQYVALAISSILKQSFKDFEFIIVDDGSTDRTIEIIESFDDSRIRLIRAEHGGFIAALKLATREAKGKWVARMDSDDICPPDRLEKQMKFLAEHPECVFVSASYGVVTPAGKLLLPESTGNFRYVEPADITAAKFLFADPATIFDRGLALEEGYDDQWQNEKPLWYRLLSRGKGVALDDPLYFMRWRMGSVSRGQLAKKGIGMNAGVRAKYDPENASQRPKTVSSRASLKDERRCVYFFAAARDRRAAMKIALQTLRRFPFHRGAFELLLVATGLRRPAKLYGPCGVQFSPKTIRLLDR